MTAALLSLDRLLAADFPVLAGSLKGARKAAATDTQVLILGEAGSGRSTVARAFHAASRRSAGPLVEMDSGAIPSTLFESELFGYRAGAFTGAEGGGEGRLARTAGGSLLLDHVEELPLSVQPKLLRLLAEGKYAPLGGREVQADVRFLTIGAEDLEQRMNREAFRPDLYYRLEVLAFRVPRCASAGPTCRPSWTPCWLILPSASAVPAPSSRPPRGPGCWSTPGRGTSASSATCWSAA